MQSLPDEQAASTGLRRITARTFADYYRVCERVLSSLGKSAVVVHLTPTDFQRLRADIAKTYGPVALGNEIQRIRVLFNFAVAADLIDRPVKFGPTFKRPSKRVLRKHRNENGSEDV